MLSKVYSYTQDGWPKDYEQELRIFGSRVEEISIDNGVLMWGYRAIIPQKLRVLLLEEIHSGHVGIAKMKAIARQYFWWPNLDKEIENYGRNCAACRSTANQPEKANLIKFKEAERPFERVHIDFLGPYLNEMYLVVIDAFSR